MRGAHGRRSLTWRSGGRAAAAAALLVGCTALPGTRGASTASGAGSAARFLPATVPESTAYRATSTYADVLRFLDELLPAAAAAGTPLARGSIGRTAEGREIPYIVASRPLLRTPAEARARGRAVVYVQANIHAGEVEGKEALLALVRDLALAPAPNVLDSLVLIAVPIYNADGNERLAPQWSQRSEQNGPELVGQRPNARGLDLNRDYVKAEAPETRASLAMFRVWDPDVFVDLHTTDGSFHGYALTYAPALNPASPLDAESRALLEEVRTRLRQRAGRETFDYGNFNDGGGREVSTDTVHTGWYTYDARPRFGTNYQGLRNRVAVLSEAYSHDPFERRIASTYAFTRQLLSLVAERGAEIRRLEQEADAGLTDRDTLPLRAALPATAPSRPVRYEILARTGDTVRTEAGVPRGVRRTGRFVTRAMPVFDRFVATRWQRVPAVYLTREDALVERLRAHGVRVDTLGAEPLGRVEHFVIDSVIRSERPFQGHHEVRVEGRWEPTVLDRSGRVYRVPTAQPLGRLAAYLLEPESDDGFTTWNVLDHALVAGGTFPVLRAWRP